MRERAPKWLLAQRREEEMKVKEVEGGAEREREDAAKLAPRDTQNESAAG